MSNTGLTERILNYPQCPALIIACSNLCWYVMPIVEIAIGAVHLDDCPRQSYIPVYLIVAGVLTLLLDLLSCLPCTQELSRVYATWNLLTSCFLFCWFIAGNMWIYSIYEPNYNKNTTDVDPYCDKTLYLFAFWTTTLAYILLGLVLVGGCCYWLCSRFA